MERNFGKRIQRHFFKKKYLLKKHFGRNSREKKIRKKRKFLEKNSEKYFGWKKFQKKKESFGKEIKKKTSQCFRILKQ